MTLTDQPVARPAHRVPGGGEGATVANDVVAPLPPSGAAMVTVNVLKNDDDPLGSPSDLKISWVPAGVSVHGASLTIRLAAQPRKVPCRFAAPNGLTATAVVYVPGTQASAIRLRPGKRITLADRNGSVTVPLSSVLMDTSGRQLKITTTDQLTASPAGNLGVSANQETAFPGARAGRSGPGAVTVQVYDGATLQDPHGETATITIPAQIGRDEPILRCPSAPLQIVEGGAPGALRHRPALPCLGGHHGHGRAAALRHGVGQGRGRGRRQRARRYRTPAHRGQRRKARHHGDATSHRRRRHRVRHAHRGGHYRAPAVRDRGRRLGGRWSQRHSRPQSVRHEPAGSAGHPGAELHPPVQGDGDEQRIDGHGHADGGQHRHHHHRRDGQRCPGPGRPAVHVSITVTVIGRPGMPGAPSAKTSNGTVVVSFTPAVPNGAPSSITVYTNSAPHQCAAAPCTISGLKNGTSYSIYVTATNSVGRGPDSRTTTATLNAVPGQVTGLGATPGDGTVALTWHAAGDPGIPVTGYKVEVSPPARGQQITNVGGTTSHTFTGLTNGTQYTFKVLARNALGSSPWSLGVTAIPFGKPLTMAAPTATGAAVPDPTATRAITVSWVPVNGTAASGRPVTRLRRLRLPGGLKRRAVRRERDRRPGCYGCDKRQSVVHRAQRQLLVRVCGHRHEPGRGLLAVSAVQTGHPGRRPAGRADRRYG